jgi:DMSO/TMAO reductase YedYZ molybdopterin-dependent catalytic subunit
MEEFMDTGIARGAGRMHPARDPRLPPGQYDIGDGFPVMSAEVTPRRPADSWTLTVDGLVEESQTWTWDDLHLLPPSEFRGDIHCVTSWSKLGTRFGGVSVDVLLEAAAVRATASHAVAMSVTGHTTNLPLPHLRGGQAWVVWTHEGTDLPAEHGGPLRLLVPHLYLWKSAKWLTRLSVLDHDEPGFWEVRGYHDLGDPWREQRYQRGREIGENSPRRPAHRGAPRER